jgi:Cdc6-like AAA superfamily ATPase
LPGNVGSIREYLQQQQQQIGQHVAVVKDFAVFDFNHVPDEPVLRPEARSLIDGMLRFEVTGVPTHLAVIGSRGSGKTLTVKYLQRLMGEQTQLTLLYANCRQHNSSYKVLAHLLGSRQVGCGLSDLFERFTERFPGRTVVVLDEIDLMSPKDRRREILYLLSRAESPYMVVMLSNSPQVLKQLDAATRSSLQPVPMHFANYDAEQLRLILEDRARRGLHDWDQQRLAQIAALTTHRTNADARVAIKTLFYTVTQPADDLETCFEQARRDIVVDMTNDLSDGNLMILQAACHGSSNLAKDVYHRYAVQSRQGGDKPFSYVHFLSQLSYLQSMGLITLVSAKHGRTYTHRILVAFDPAVVESLCRLRFH